MYRGAQGGQQAIAVHTFWCGSKADKKLRAEMRKYLPVAMGYAMVTLVDNDILVVVIR